VVSGSDSVDGAQVIVLQPGEHREGMDITIATGESVDRTPESVSTLLKAQPHATEVELAANGSAQVSLALPLVNS
jgi:hypothetical protein